MGDADRGLVDGFRERLAGAGLIVRSFASSDGLELEVFHALSELVSGSLSTVMHDEGAPEHVPRIWNVPNRNAGFTGRATTLVS
jgi:hypothetical protein